MLRERIGANFFHFRLNLNFYSSTPTPSSIPKTLNSAQVAFVNRIGADQIPASKLLSALSHPKFMAYKTHQEAPNNPEFQNLIKIGNDSLQFFTREYLKTRFPSLADKYLQVGMKTLLADKNLLQFAMFLGIDAACGIDSHLKEKWILENKNKKTKKKKKSSKIEQENFNETEIRLDCFKALLGIIGTEAGPLNLRKFLDSRYFNNSQFNPSDFIRPLYPIPDLAELYPDLVFRLHQESGRLSSHSMFIVGVYADKTSQNYLGEGYGSSQALAQHRAATDALRKLFLKEQRVMQRPSDHFKDKTELLKVTL